MTDFTPGILHDELARDEEYRTRIYTDTQGKLTGGIGWNFTDNGIPDAVIEFLYSIALTKAQNSLDIHVPWWRSLSDVRQRVLLNMCYNMGWSNVDGTHGLCTFVNTLEDIRNGQYNAAAKGMLASHWAQQVGERATRLAEMMRNG